MSYYTNTLCEYSKSLVWGKPGQHGHYSDPIQGCGGELSFHHATELPRSISWLFELSDDLLQWYFNLQVVSNHLRYSLEEASITSLGVLAA